MHLQARDANLFHRLALLTDQELIDLRAASTAKLDDDDPDPIRQQLLQQEIRVIERVLRARELPF